MGIFKNLFGEKKQDNEGYTLKLITEKGNGFFSYDGNLFKSDIVRSCIRPKSKAIGKLQAKHIRNFKGEFQVNPDVYMRFLLEEPNPFMCGQVFQEKLANQLELNNNAFALIVRDDNGFARQLYNISANSVEAKYKNNGELYLKFLLNNGKFLEADYTDIIHLRQDFNNNDLFGDSPAPALTMLMQTVNTIDQGIVKAVKNSSIVKWLMKFKSTIRPDDMKTNIKEFQDNYLDIDSDSGGVVANDTKYDLEQVKTDTGFVANAGHMKEIHTRVFNFFNTNIDIIQSKWNEDTWNAFYEGQVEPAGKQLRNEYTRKLFTRKERGFGNEIIFDSMSLAYASMSTKLNLVQMVDRGAMTPNEWRKVLNMAPIENGDKPIRRLDTAVVEGGEIDADKD